MKAWRLERLGGSLTLTDVPTPEPRPGSVLVRIEAAALMSYLKAYVRGQLPIDARYAGAFTIGTNRVGVVEAVGRDVWHLEPGQRLMISPHVVARDNVDDPNAAFATLLSLRRGGRFALV
jgi:alcohol dehydrogenase